MSNNESILKGPGFIAQLKFYSCKTRYGCKTACPENAITRGPERLPERRMPSLTLWPVR